MEYLQVVGLVLTAITGTSGGGFFGYLISRRRQFHQESIELLPHLVRRIDALEASHEKCLRDHAESQNKIGRIEEAAKQQGESSLALTKLAGMIAILGATVDRIEKSNGTP